MEPQATQEGRTPAIQEVTVGVRAAGHLFRRSDHKTEIVLRQAQLYSGIHQIPMSAQPVGWIKPANVNHLLLAALHRAFGGLNPGDDKTNQTKRSDQRARTPRAAPR
jgi:hypothetical protein